MRDVRHPEAPEGRSVSRQTLGLAMAVWLVLLVLAYLVAAIYRTTEVHL